MGLVLLSAFHLDRTQFLRSQSHHHHRCHRRHHVFPSTSANLSKDGYNFLHTAAWLRCSMRTTTNMSTAWINIHARTFTHTHTRTQRRQNQKPQHSKEGKESTRHGTINAQRRDRETGKGERATDKQLIH